MQRPLVAAIAAIALPSVAVAQTWQVTDLYSSGPLGADGSSTSLTLSAEADVRTGETGHRGLAVLLSYGCETFIERFPQFPALDTNDRTEDVLLVGRAPLIAAGSRPRTLSGSYAVDGRMRETDSRWAVATGSEEFARYRGPNARRLIDALIRGAQVEIRIRGDSGAQTYRFPLAGSARAIGEARQHCRIAR